MKNVDEKNFHPSQADQFRAFPNKANAIFG